MELIGSDVGNKVHLPKEDSSYGYKKESRAINPYLLLFTILIIFSRRDIMGPFKKESYDAESNMINTFKNLLSNQDLEKVLSLVCPYLSEEDQTPIHTVAGILQLVNTTKKVKESSYRIPSINNQMQINREHDHLEIIRVLKEYANQEDKSVLEAIESGLNAMRKIKIALNNDRNIKNQGNESDNITELVKSLNEINN